MERRRISRNIQEEFRSALNEILKKIGLWIKRSNWYNKNIQKLHNVPKKVLNFYNNYTRMVSEAKYKSIYGGSKY